MKKTSHVQKQLQPFKAEKHHLIKGRRAATHDQQGESEGNAQGEFYIHRIRNESVWTKAKAGSNKQLRK